MGMGVETLYFGFSKIIAEKVEKFLLHFPKLFSSGSWSSLTTCWTCIDLG